MPGDVHRPSAELLRLFEGVSSASASGDLRRMGFNINTIYARGIHPIVPGGRIVGPAVTIRYVPARDDLAERERGNQSRTRNELIETLQPGDVLVIDALGREDGGHIGDVIATRVQSRGAAGVIIDGAVRDVPFIRGMAMPVFARSATGPPSPLTPIDVNVPVNCGGAAVVPGDIVVADDDGVCIVPRERAEELARICVEHEELEVWLRERLAGGESIVGVYPPNDEVRRQFHERQR
jgi:5-oxopent-3-ene-1,2,5-tricarboxylate decarboxylase/2-hydroxyhepta-2,4-diene-1,7-dioate isomerase